MSGSLGANGKWTGGVERTEFAVALIGVVATFATTVGMATGKFRSMQGGMEGMANDVG